MIGKADQSDRAGAATSETLNRPSRGERAIRLLYILLCVLVMAIVTDANPQSSLRGAVPEDLNRLESIGERVISPDGELVAYVRIRSKNDGAAEEMLPFVGTTRSDVWIGDLRSGATKNITRGSETKAGYLLPRWSPDSGHLALLSIKGREVHLLVWDRALGSIRQVAEQNVYLSHPSGITEEQTPFAWVGKKRLICRVFLGEPPRSPVDLTLAEGAAISGWEHSWKNDRASVSVLESGLLGKDDKPSSVQFRLIDLDGGLVGIFPAEGNLNSALSTSADGHRVAFLQSIGVFEAQRNARLTYNSLTSNELIILDDAGRLIAKSSAKFGGSDPSWLGNDIDWSPNQQEVVIVTSASDGPQWFRCAVDSGVCTAIAAPRGYDEVSRVRWTADNRLLLYCSSGPREESHRSDWWLQSPDNAVNLTKGLAKPPESILTLDDGHSFMGLADGKIWSIRPEAQSVERVAPGVDAITRILGATVKTDHDKSKRWLIVSQSQHEAPNSENRKLYRLDVALGTLELIERPRSNAYLITDSYARNENLLFGASDRTGSYLWSCGGTPGSCRLMVEMNKYFGEIVQGKARMIRYRGLDGQMLWGVVMLPVNYQEGKRYPLVVKVYHGAEIGENYSDWMNSDAPIGPDINWFSLLAAHGYAVLAPSEPVPLGKGSYYGTARDPLMELQNGVIPAIDKVIDLGIADPARLAVIGASYGGYSVLGLITQTNRFRAAIAIAGISDLASKYGTFMFENRYGTAPPESTLEQAAPSESGQESMGSPLWVDPDRYVRNSPIFFADQVKTPLLLIHGDVDPNVPIEQSEEFFTALYRQGKRAEFVRYFGEQHKLDGKETVLDMWYRIYAWLDEFLVADKSTVTSP